MFGSERKMNPICFPLLAVLLMLVVCRLSAWADSGERTNVYVVVKDAETDQPIFQARITLQFREPGSKVRLKRSKLRSYSAKTNAQGRYKFTDIPKGTIRLIVTSERRQTYGKELELEQDDQVFEVKLKKPQELL